MQQLHTSYCTTCILLRRTSGGSRFFCFTGGASLLRSAMPSSIPIPAIVTINDEPP